MSKKVYSVYVGGSEINDEYLNKKQAVALAEDYIARGYDDTEIDTYTVQYHVFSDECDEWFDHYNQAYELYREWAEEKGCARLYEEIYSPDEMIHEDCIKSKGGYPR